jgi:hypothetical protein
MIYSTVSGQFTGELYDGKEFLRLDALKPQRKIGLYVGHKNHISEVKFGRVIEAYQQERVSKAAEPKPGLWKSLHPLDDETPFDLAVLDLSTNLIISIWEFKDRDYSSNRKFPYGPEVKKANEMRSLAKQWGVKSYFAHRWSDGIICLKEITDEFFRVYASTISPLFNAKPNRPGETPDDVFQLKPESHNRILTLYGKGIF